MDIKSKKSGAYKLKVNICDRDGWISVQSLEVKTPLKLQLREGLFQWSSCPFQEDNVKPSFAHLSSAWLSSKWFI